MVGYELINDMIYLVNPAVLINGLFVGGMKANLFK